MRNLELRNLVRQPLKNIKNVEYSVFAGDYLCLVRNEPQTNDYEVLIYDINNPDTNDVFEISEVFDVFQCEHLPFHGLVWIGTKTEFILIDPANQSVTRINQYASSEDREILVDLNDLENARWDPTGNFIIVTKVDGTISVFVVDFIEATLEELETSNIHDVVFKAEQLNWGSAERQFRSQDEQLANKTFKDEGEYHLLYNDSFRLNCTILVPVTEEKAVTNISWRQNGENVVVNYNNKGKRKLKVYDEAWKLINESEDIPGLQSVIAWKASSVVFAGVVHTSKRTQIIIFEKNCEIKNRYDLERKVSLL